MSTNDSSDIENLVKDLLGDESGSDMNDYELVNNLKKIYEWGIGTGRQLENGTIKKVDDREWEMIANRLDQFEQTFTNRAKRNLRKKIVKPLEAMMVKERIKTLQGFANWSGSLTDEAVRELANMEIASLKSKLEEKQ